MNAITKSFPGVQALREVTLEVYPGEVLALMGENGAGKSTLMKVLNGVYGPDAGSIVWAGRPVSIRSPHHAQALGISMIHQELALIPYLDVGKNIYLGREPQAALPGTVDWRTLYRQAREQLDHLGLAIDPRTSVRSLSIAQQQMVEVAKALSLQARLIVMDEPTSSLTEREVVTLFQQIRTLKAKGVAFIFISHRMEEVFEIADRVTVLRDGALVGTHPKADLSEAQIIRMMVGREVRYGATRREATTANPVVLEADKLTREGVIHEVSFKLHRGEILGVAGLVGAGRTELAETVFGVHPATGGALTLEGRPVRIQTPGQAIELGIGLVPEDRKGQGLFLSMDVGTNVVMAMLRRLTRAGLIRWSQVAAVARDFIQRLSIRTPSAQQRVRNLSGGNQQKVVIAKWLTREPKVLILDEPTRGIDVGAKAEIHRLMDELAGRGVGILMISSELPEVLGVSDRVLVMSGGRLVGEFDPRTASQDDILRAATGMV
jgi:ribose transport system ATP-binding protein